MDPIDILLICFVLLFVILSVVSNTTGLTAYQREIRDYKLGLVATFFLCVGYVVLRWMNLLPWSE